MRILAIAALMLLAESQTNAQTSAMGSVRHLDSLWAQSYAKNDTILARQLMADDIVITSSDGRNKTREMEMNDIRATPGGTIHYFRTSEVTIRTRGDASVAAGLAEWSFTFRDKTWNTKRRYTATFARGGPLGRQLIALHLGPASREPDLPPTIK